LTPAPCTLATLALMVGSLVSTASLAETPGCGAKFDLALNVSVQSPDLSVCTDFAADKRRAMAPQVPGPQRHPPLGFYKDAVGYRVALDARAGPDSPCPSVGLDVRLVVVERTIEIARDLQATPCLFEAALRHYQRHAAVAASTLRKVAAALPDRLTAELSREVPTGAENAAAFRRRAETRVNAVLTDAIAELSRKVAVLQADVDDPAEVAILAGSCHSI
jgi:hypothetical protein